jgi:hypothetical protein
LKHAISIQPVVTNDWPRPVPKNKGLCTYKAPQHRPSYSASTRDLTPVKRYGLLGLLSDQTQPSVQDSDGKRRASVDDYALGKRLKLTMTEGVGLNLTSAKKHNMNVENNEFKGTDRSQGEETVHRNLQGVYETKQSNTMESFTTGGIAESLHADADGASSITKSGPLENAAEEIAMTNSGDIAAHGDKLVNDRVSPSAATIAW